MNANKSFEGLDVWPEATKADIDEAVAMMRQDGIPEHVAVEIAKDRAEIIRLTRENVRLTELATKDALTGLFNRRYLNELLENEWARSERQKTPFSILMFDADHFKKINDTLGHKAGDLALQILAQTIKKVIRKSDSAARYGGEEFTIVLPDTGAEGALAVAEKLRTEVEQHLKEELKEKLKLDKLEGIAGTVSIGVSTWNGVEEGCAGDVNELRDRADRALYRAKAEGRNRAVAYHPGIKEVIPVNGNRAPSAQAVAEKTTPRLLQAVWDFLGVGQ